MSSKDDNGAAMGFAVVVAGVVMLAYLVFALAVLVVFVLTILAFIAWNNPLTIGNKTIYPHEARRFVAGGAFGAIVILAGVIRVVIRGFLLRPLDALSTRFAALAGGDRSKPADVEGMCEELQTLAGHYDTLRTAEPTTQSPEPPVQEKAA